MGQKQREVSAAEFRPEQIEMSIERDVLPPILMLEDFLAQVKQGDGDIEQFQALRAALKK